MVIFVGGLPGAGKSSVARFLAEKLSIYYYDVDEVKKVIGPQDPDFEYNMRQGIPFTKEVRLKVFKKVVDDFEPLSETNAHLVVDESPLGTLGVIVPLSAAIALLCLSNKGRLL